MNHGLSGRQLEALKRILSLCAEEITRVDLFGSRASGGWRDNSDVDLVLRGDLKEKQIDRLWTLFQESSLPFSVDVKSYERTAWPPLRARMDVAARPLFTQEELRAAAREAPEA